MRPSDSSSERSAAAPLSRKPIPTPPPRRSEAPSLFACRFPPLYPSTPVPAGALRASAPRKPGPGSRVEQGALGEQQLGRQTRMGAALPGRDPARQPRRLRRALRGVCAAAVHGGPAAAPGKPRRGGRGPGRYVPRGAGEPRNIQVPRDQRVRLAGADRHEQGGRPPPPSPAHRQSAGELRRAALAAARARPRSGAWNRAGAAARGDRGGAHRSVPAVSPRGRAADARGPAAPRVRPADGDQRGSFRRPVTAGAARLPGGLRRATRQELGGAMTAEEKPPTEAELREAELLARALEGPDEPGRDLSPVEDALGAAYLLRESRRMQLGELRARAVQKRIWPRRSRARSAAAVLLAAGAAAAAIVLWPRRAAELPAPSVQLLRAQLAAARPGEPATIGPLAAEMAGYRAQIHGALARAYGAHL